MRMLVLGAGLQGSACAYDLLQNVRVQEVVLADVRLDALPPFLEKHRNDARLKLVQIDARNDQEVRAAMRGMNASMNALPYYFNVAVAGLAVQEGVHYADLGGNTAM